MQAMHSLVNLGESSPISGEYSWIYSSRQQDEQNNQYVVYASLSTIFDSLHNNMNQDLAEKHLCNQGSHYENYGRFPLCMQRKPSRATTKSTLFAVSKDEWNTKAETGYCMKKALYVLHYVKRPKAMSNSKNIKLLKLAVIRLYLSEGIRGSVGQSVRQFVSQSEDIPFNIFL